MGAAGTQGIIPCDKLLADLQAADPDYPILSLFDAESAGQISLPAECDRQTQIGSSVFLAPSHPETLALRRGKLWLTVPSAALRQYLLGVFSRSQWRGKTWEEIKNSLFAPETEDALRRFFVEESGRRADIQFRLDEIARLDLEIEEQVLALYGMTGPATDAAS